MGSSLLRLSGQSPPYRARTGAPSARETPEAVCPRQSRPAPRGPAPAPPSNCRSRPPSPREPASSWRHARSVVGDGCRGDSRLAVNNAETSSFQVPCSDFPSRHRLKTLGKQGGWRGRSPVESAGRFLGSQIVSGCREPANSARSFCLEWLRPCLQPASDLDLMSCDSACQREASGRGGAVDSNAAS